MVEKPLKSSKDFSAKTLESKILEANLKHVNDQIEQGFNTAEKKLESKFLVQVNKTQQVTLKLVADELGYDVHDVYDYDICCYFPWGIKQSRFYPYHSETQWATCFLPWKIKMNNISELHVPKPKVLD